MSIEDELIAHVTGNGSLPFPKESFVEVHTLVSHEHVPLYLIALSSLSRFWIEPAIWVHDDGTLTLEDVQWIRRKLPAAQIVRNDMAERVAECMLQRYPTVATVRRSNVRLRQLIDYYLHGQADMVVGMDSDIVFLNYPDEVVDWSRQTSSDGPCFYYSPEMNPSGPHWLPSALPGKPFLNDICCGFVCARRSIFLDLEYLENMMISTPSEILNHGRFVTQMFYALLGARLGEARCQSLPERYRSGRLQPIPALENRAICHYFASQDRTNARQNLLEEAYVLRRGLGLS